MTEGPAPADTETDGVTPDTHVVEIRRFPLRLWARATEHHEELMREFALLAINPPLERAGHDVPKRLLDLIDMLGRRYAATTADVDAVRDAAAETGAESVDLSYRVPTQAAEACRALDALLDEADDYCLAGDQLLTLAASADAVQFRRWYLGEFVSQIEGRPPAPWTGSLH